MPDFKAKMYQIQSQTPLGEPTALPQTSKLDLRGPTSKEREGRGKGEGRPPIFFPKSAPMLSGFISHLQRCS